MIRDLFIRNGVLTGLAVLIVMAASLPGCNAAEKAFSPWDFDQSGMQGKAINAEEGKTVSPGGAVLIGAVRFYQKHVSPVISGRCPMYPSCSAYSIEAIKKHGFFMGVLMTADRFIRENTEMDRAPIVEVNGELFYYDPVENNDFWWASPKRRQNGD